MITRRPGPRRMSLGPRSFLSLTLLCSLMVIVGAPAPLVSTLLAEEPSPVLEVIEYRRNGQVEQTIGEIEIAGDRVRLRLFSEQLASHYEIWIEIGDFIGAAPLASEELAATLAARAARIEAHRIEREEARKRRLEKREAEEAKEERGAAARSTRRGGGSEGVEVERTQSPEDLAGFAKLAKQLDRRIETAHARCSDLLGDIAPRLAVARTQKRTLRRIAATIEDGQSELDAIETGLSGRKQSIDRVEADVRAGVVRGRQLTDHLSSMGRRFERLEKRLDKVERGLEREARSLISLPAEPVEPPEGLAESGEGETSGAVTRVSGARERASRSTRSRRLDPVASHNARVAEAVSAIEEEAGPTSATSEERPEAAVVAPSALAEEPRVEPEAREAESAAETGVNPYPTGGGLPVWPLYPLAILACYLLWRGQRGEKVDRGALPGPRQP